MKSIKITLTLALCWMGNLHAQSFFEFNNRHLSQSQLWNPGFMPQYKATLSFGQSTVGGGIIGTTLNGLFGSTETPLQTVTRMIGEDEKQLGIDLFQQTDLFHFGFRSKKSYFSINSTFINEAAIRLPKDLLGLAFLGNGAFIEKDAEIDFSGNQFRSYMKNTFSYGRFLTNELSVGFNAALINGISDLSINRARFGIGTDTGTASIYSLNLNGEIEGRASLLGADINRVLNDSTYDVNKSVMDQVAQISLGTNQGYALGFGAVYRLNEKIRLSGSVQNLGSIVWNLGAQELILEDSRWEWNGLDTSQVSNLNEDVAQQIQDTFLQKFEIKSGSINSYTTALKPRYTLGAEFLLFPRTHIQAFGGYGFGIHGDKSFISTSVHQEVGEWIDLRIGYSLYDFENPSHRVGLGISLNLGPIQVFTAVNDVLGIVNYGSMQHTSGTIGMNINIGRRKDRDYDEIPDKQDSCFKTFGVISNDGCPYGFLGGSMTYDETEEVPQESSEESTEINIIEVEENAETEPKKTPETSNSIIPQAKSNTTSNEELSTMESRTESLQEISPNTPEKTEAAALETTAVEDEIMGGLPTETAAATTDNFVDTLIDSTSVDPKEGLTPSEMDSTDTLMNESIDAAATATKLPVQKVNKYKKPKSPAKKSDTLEDLMNR